MREIIMGSNESGKKLENYLKKEFPIGYVRKLFRKNGIRLNGERAKPADVISAGDKIQLYIPFDTQRPRTPTTSAAPKLDIIFEDSNLLVIDKPAGLAVHEGKTVSKRDSVLGILERQYRDESVQTAARPSPGSGYFRPSVSREESKNRRGVEASLRNRRGDKEYLALVVGRLANNQGKLDTPLPGREGNPVRALTRYWVVKRYSEVTLVRVAIETGRMHQIRLHFAQLGHPVVMDDQHGDFAFNKQFRKEFGLKRQFLHAAKAAP